MAKVLITGGAGYIGSVITEHFLINGWDVIIIDNCMYGRPQLNHLAKYGTKLKFKNWDVVQNDFILWDTVDLYKPDVIIPLAALVGEPACRLNDDNSVAWKINVNHVKTLTERVAATRDIVLIYPNTNSGYGINSTGICTEESPLNPISVYGITKVEAEKIILENGGISFRLATVFGPSPRMRRDLLVNDFVYRAMFDKHIVLYEKDFKRNYIHIHDVARAFLWATNESWRKQGQVYNLGLDNANLSKYELALKIKQHLPETEIIINEFKKDPDQRNYIVSNEKIKKAGFDLIWNLDEGIKQLITLYSMLGRQEMSNV